MNSWASFFLTWISLESERFPIIVIRYEDLKNDLLREVKRMLGFLRVPYTEEELQKRMGHGYTLFKRLHKGDDFGHFTSDQRQLVISVVQETVDILQRNYTTHGIEKYLS